MSHSQFHSIELFILRHAWLNLWDKHMTTGRINQVTISKFALDIRRQMNTQLVEQRVLLYPPKQIFALNEFINYYRDSKASWDFSKANGRTALALLHLHSLVVSFGRFSSSPRRINTSLCSFSGLTNLGVDLRALIRGPQITFQCEDYFRLGVNTRFYPDWNGSPNELSAFGMAIGK